MIEKLSCHFCASRCGIQLHMENGKVIKAEGDPEHPVSRGWSCRRGRADTVRRYRQLRKEGKDTVAGLRWRWKEDGMTVTRTNPWTGPGCHNGCGILVYTKGNEVIKVEGDPDTPFNEGRLCARCLALPKVVQHPDRLTSPLKRVGERGKGKWKQITWDEAYQIIVDNVRRIQKEYGPESIVALGGTGRNIYPLLGKLCYSGFGSPNLDSGFLSGRACYTPRITLQGMVSGCFYVPDCSQMFPARYDNPNWKIPKSIVIWGNNPVVSNPDSIMGYWFIECMKRGSKLVVIDSRLTWLASRAEIWLQPRPGTDAAIALGMLNVIIEEELYDREFVDKWTSGFDRLRERVKDYPPDKVEQISWVPKEKLIAAARHYATSKPAAIQFGVTLEQHRIGMSTLLGVHNLWGITGNVDVPGGNIINLPTKSYDIPPMSWGSEDVSAEAKNRIIGGEQYPLMMAKVGVPRAVPDLIAEAMLTEVPYPIKMAWLQTTNPVACMAAEPQRVYHAMRKLDFVVVVDLFMTPSAVAFADIVLPAGSALERDSLRTDTYGRAWWGPLRAINKVVKVGNCKSDEEIILDVGKRLNPRAFPWENVEEMLDYLLRDTGMSFADLREQGLPIYSPFEYRKYEKGLLRADGKPGFDTPTGKLMLYLLPFEELGLDPLPYYEEPPESPVSTPELAKKYPLILTTGARSPAFFHSEHRQIPEMREIHHDPMVEIHPDTALRLGIEDGDWVWIENEHGRCRQRAKLTETIDRRVVSAQHGWWFPEKPAPEPSLFGVWESNVNQLMPLGQNGPSGWCAPYKSLICKIYKFEEKRDA